MEEKIFTIVQWVYFTYNFPSPQSLCKQIWGDTALADHIYHKLVSYDMNFNRLFCELSRDNQRLLANWVIEHYHGVDSRRPV